MIGSKHFVSNSSLFNIYSILRFNAQFYKKQQYSLILYTYLQISTKSSFLIRCIHLNFTVSKNKLCLLKGEIEMREVIYLRENQQVTILQAHQCSFFRTKFGLRQIDEMKEQLLV